MLSIFCTLGACATYQPGSLKPDETARQFAGRTLANPELCAYLNTNPTTRASGCPPPRWDLPRLTLAGLFYNPDLALAETQLKVAQAAIITAGQRPNPSLGIGSAYAATAAPNFAPWALGTASLNFPIETPRKRRYRIAQAERLADAAALRVGETAWRVRSAIRAALVNYLIAQDQFALARAYEAASERIAQLLQERVEAGAAAAPELNLSLANLATARLEAARAQSSVPEALNALATAVGIPVGHLQRVTFVWPEFRHLPEASSLPPDQLRRLALLDRLDLRRTLADYAAADEALKLEIARQYPDINLAGGYSWEVNENIFELFPVVTLPLMNRNQGPIAEARARRAQAAAQFVALQDTIIGQADGALTKYRGALAALRQASRAAALSEERLAGMQRAAALGEIDGVTLASVQLATVVAKQSNLSTFARAQTALGELEDVIERPLQRGDLQSLTLPARFQHIARD
jgi:cobalt-zinc-cadmium efflux system outer membrane protein